MKRLLHILLISLYVFSCTELKELTKLPILFQHYFEHKGIDQNITFWWYIQHHYSDIPHTDDDDDRDNQLPFKTTDISFGQTIAPALPPSDGNSLKKIDTLISKHKIKVNNDRSPHSAYAGKIWQPPKSVIIS